MNTDDPIEQFFERERSTIQPLPTSEDHWRSIVEEHRRTRRRPQAWRWVAGAAAAVVVVGGLGLALRPRPDEGTIPATSSSLSASTPALTPPTTVVTVTQTVSGTPTTVTVPTTVSTPAGPVLQRFDVVSMTNSGRGHRAVLGRASCSGKPCTAVITTTDDGARWSVASSDPETVPGPDGPRSIRFANDRVGWLVGKTVKRTTDGGASWEEYPHPGGYVFALETDGRDVVIVAGNKPTMEASNQIIVSRAPVSASSASAVGDPLAAVGFTGVDVVWNEHTAYISPDGLEGASGIFRVDAKALVPLPAQPADVPVGFAGSAGDRTLFSFGPLGGAAGSTEYSVSASTDGGKTWTKRTGDQPLRLVNAGQTAFAATDTDHVVAVSGGNADTKGSMKVSSDGGRTWRDPKQAPPMPAQGWGWVGSPGGDVVYAIPADPSGPYWWSKDSGETWQRAVLNR